MARDVAGGAWEVGKWAAGVARESLGVDGGVGGGMGEREVFSRGAGGRRTSSARGGMRGRGMGRGGRVGKKEKEEEEEEERKRRVESPEEWYSAYRAKGNGTEGDEGRMRFSEEEVESWGSKMEEGRGWKRGGYDEDDPNEYSAELRGMSDAAATLVEKAARGGIGALNGLFRDPGMAGGFDNERRGGEYRGRGAGYGYGGGGYAVRNSNGRGGSMRGGVWEGAERGRGVQGRGVGTRGAGWEVGVRGEGRVSGGGWEEERVDAKGGWYQGGGGYEFFEVDETREFRRGAGGFRRRGVGKEDVVKEEEEKVGERTGQGDVLRVGFCVYGMFDQLSMSAAARSDVPI